jgi:UDP-glucose 4-epimerase
MKIVITGGAGFIGSQLATKLVSMGGFDITLIDNMSDGHLDNIIKDKGLVCPLVIKDIRSKLIENEISGTDVIIHLAGTSSLPKCQADAAMAYDNNVTGLANVLDLARRANVKRVIFSSTSAVYENNKNLPFAESDLVNPSLVYSSTKLAAEQLCAAFSQTYGIDIIVARFFNVYGEHQDIHRVMPPFISYLAKEVFFGREPILFNNTDAVRDYVYVGDVIRCLINMINSHKYHQGEIFNICSGSAYSVKEIVSKYSKIAEREIKPQYEDASKFWDKFPSLFEGRFPLSRERIKEEVFKNSIGNPTKSQNILDFRASTSLEEGLSKVFHFAKKSLDK